MRDIDLNLLTVFDAVMIERNLRKAGERLHRSQPAISQAVARLRHEMNDQLFERTPTGVIPTARAEVLWQEIRDPLARIRDAMLPMQFVPSEQTGERVFGLSDDVRILFWPKLAKSITQEARRIKLRSVDCDHLNVWDSLSTGRIDLALTVAGQPPPGFGTQLLHTDSFVLLVKQGTEPPSTAKQYAELRHLALVFADERAAYADEALGAEGHSREVVARVSRFDALPGLVKALDAVVALPEMIACHFAREHGLNVCPLPIAFPAASLKLCWHEKNRYDAQHLWLRTHITEAMQSLLANV